MEKIILASQSPRRQQLLKDTGISFSILVKDVEEIIPEGIKPLNAAKYLAELKASAYDQEIEAGHTIITADTIVLLENEILGKPKDKVEAHEMLSKLSGKSHDVITGVCIKSSDDKTVFDCTTKVHFHNITSSQIDYYIDNFKPFDKAGAYGIQEWIGLVGIDKIVGSYFNVVGLPVDEVYKLLKAKNITNSFS